MTMFFGENVLALYSPIKQNCTYGWAQKKWQMRQWLPGIIVLDLTFSKPLGYDKAECSTTQ